MEFDDFAQVHGVLLAASGLPQSLHRKLHQKLSHDVFDGGDHFQVEEVEVEGGVQRRLVLHAEKLDKESDVFLVDHAWSFRLADARKQLEQMPPLVERMAALMGVTGSSPATEECADLPENETAQTVNEVLDAAEREAAESGAPVRWLELDECGLDDAGVVALKLGEKYPDLVGLSLWGNKIATTSALLEALRGLTGLRALWLNDNTVCKDGAAVVFEALHPHLPSLQVLNSHVTPDYSLWSLGLFASVYGAHAAGVDGSSREQRHPLWTVHELDLSGRGLEFVRPEFLNETEAPTLRSLDVSNNPFSAQNASEIATVLQRLPTLRSLKIDVPGPLGATLKDVADALPHISLINGLERDAILAAKGPVPLTALLRPRLPTWHPGEPLVDRVMRAMWQFVNMYRLATEEKLDETPVWYVMDELGSAARHSDRPNLVCTPFMYLADGTLNSAISYSILWPSEDIRQGDECARDYLRGISEEKQRSSRLTAWFYTPSDYFDKVFSEYRQRLAAVHPPAVPLQASVLPVQSIRPADGRPLKVFTDIREGMEHLTRPDFVQVDEPHEADIVWAFDQIDEAYRSQVKMTSEQYVNQFPFEACLVMKHHLAATIKKAIGAPTWLQPTYELDSELPAFIGDFQEREREAADNMWILKPWNMARSIDASVTRNLAQVIRFMETGPKICQKYIERPATFRGRKFDLRLVVLLRSVRPLELMLYDIFWARTSNKPYTTDQSSLDDYDTHFTVMNYGGRKLEHVNMDAFVAEFGKEHNVNWSSIHERIRAMLRAVFEGAARLHPEMHDPHARAMYGVDVMLDHEMQPKLLEITYCPDTMRACKYDVPRLKDGKLLLGKDFYNRVFGCLFYKEDEGFEVL